jgi:hypothetical protein
MRREAARSAPLICSYPAARDRAVTQATIRRDKVENRLALPAASALSMMCSMAVVYWGWDGVTGGVVLLAASALTLSVALDERIDRPSAHAGLRATNWRTWLLGIGAAFLAMVAVAGLWGAVHVRDIQFAVAQLDADVGVSTSYDVKATDGRRFLAHSGAYRRLRVGATAECQVLGPPFILRPMLVSCERRPPR